MPIGPALLALCLAVLPRGARAEEGLHWGGCLKSLYQGSRSILTAAPYDQDLSRARLTADWTRGAWRAQIEYDNELYAGSYLQTPEFKLTGLPRPLEYFHWDRVLEQGPESLWRHKVYRGWAGLESDQWTFRAGRQRIAWGTGKFWNPTDILNPYQPLTLERDERYGVDALYLRRSLGPLSQAELAYGPQDRAEDSGLLGRLRGRLWGGDISCMGGKIAGFRRSWLVGGDGAWDAAGGILRGEWSYNELETRAPFFRWDAGWDYEFSKTAPRVLREASVLLEYYHNGMGEANPALYNVLDLLGGKDISLARDYLGAGYARDLHPLVNLQINGIANLTDGSLFVGPALTWNALENLRLSAGWQAFDGAARSEYGRLNSISYVQAQLYF